VVFDAASLHSSIVRVTPDTTVLLSATGGHVELPGASTRGWIRRLAPAGWDQNVQLGSHEAAVMAARVALLAAIMREPSVAWVTPVDQLFAAENKIVQYRAAIAAGLRIPRTMIAADREALAAELGEPFILKALGPGHFQANDQQHVVYVTERRSADLVGVDLSAAPFIAQSVVRAERHLRIVTVRDEAWVAELEASGLPLDWRSHGPAHSSFRAAAWPDARVQATRLAASLGVGMTCQDWIVDRDGLVFLDLNPGGQWLFLPEEVSSPATQALAHWLVMP
jgi:glutathione synthase/RimK-type ligase-like ATP-grasp enzyme